LSALVDHPERELDVPLNFRGTDFQKRVWALLRQIPLGTRTYYGAIAAQLGERDARNAPEAIASNSSCADGLRALPAAASMRM